MKQRKKESTRDFKARVVEVKNKLNTGTYIEKNNLTIIDIAEQYIEWKHIDGITSDRSYKRDLETLEQIKKACYNFCNIPIQKVSIVDIENAKRNMRKYANSVIGKIWALLRKVFDIACSPSRKILMYNIMLDETLKKPLSEKKSKEVKALTKSEFKKLNNILDNQEREHPYRNVIKMQSISAMRIGEVLARSRNDYNIEAKTFNIHNTLTQDDKYNIILGKHTKTYNKQTQTDKGQRYLPLDNKLFAELVEIIEEQCKKSTNNMYNLLFWDYKRNTFIKPTEVNSWLRRLNEKYKISEENLSTHRLRHYAITYWKELGIDLSVIQYLAGHIEGSKITEKVYINISDEYIKEEIKKKS